MLKSLTLLVTIAVATCNADDSPSKAIESIPKVRSTQPITTWVYSDLSSCLPMPSNAQNYCGVKYNTPAYIVTSSTFTILTTSLQLLWAQSNLDSTCTKMIKDVICKGTFPRCRAHSQSITFDDFKNSCSSLTSCISASSSIANILNHVCKLSGKSYNLNSCSKFTGETFSAQYCGKLPQNIVFPTWITETLDYQQTEIDYIQTSLPGLWVSKSCQAKWMNMTCVLPLFCSSDRTKLLTAVTRSVCQDAMNCLPVFLRTILKTAYNCNFYPTESNQTVCMPADKAYKLKGSPSCTLSGGANSGLVIGSFLLYLMSFTINYIF